MARNGTVDRIESAANITLVVSRGEEVGVTNFDGSLEDTEEIPAGYIQIPISRLDTTKEVSISEIRESSLKASGYSITSISYSGTMMFKGSRVTKTLPDKENDGDDKPESKAVTDFLYDKHGVPQPVTININHELDSNDEAELYEHVLVNSESYEVRSEEESETAFDWVAMDRASDQPNDSPGV
jgi:hypothetical protein